MSQNEVKVVTITTPVEEDLYEYDEEDENNDNNLDSETIVVSDGVSASYANRAANELKNEIGEIESMLKNVSFRGNGYDSNAKRSENHLHVTVDPSR